MPTCNHHPRSSRLTPHYFPWADANPRGIDQFAPREPTGLGAPSPLAHSAGIAFGPGAPDCWSHQRQRPRPRTTTAHLLLIDNDPGTVPEKLRRAFPQPTHRLQVAGTPVGGLGHILGGSPDVIVLGPGLPDQSRLEVYEQIRRINPRVPVIFITTAKRADAAIEAMKKGAFDCLFKPLELSVLRRVVGEALDVAGACVNQPWRRKPAWMLTRRGTRRHLPGNGRSVTRPSVA